MEAAYLDNPADWAVLARTVREAGCAGVDTEFYGVDVRKQSCVGRARVHVWSVAVPMPSSLTPRGYRSSWAYVLPAEALDHPATRAWLEDPSVEKCLHNASVDRHAMGNRGVRLRGYRDTLNLARWAWPELVSTPGRYGLKSLAESKLGLQPVCEYKELVAGWQEVTYERPQRFTVRWCSCGQAGCRRRKVGHDKTTQEGTRVITKSKRVAVQVPLEFIVPGHERWSRLVEYAAFDAVMALAVRDLALADLEREPAPWPYSDGGRPDYDDDVTTQVVEMEAVGIPIDAAWCAEALERALADEQADLAWLHRWFLLQHQGPYRREDVDPVWSSWQQLRDVLDGLGVPHSPVWKKGRVKPGEYKLDGTAREWVARAHPQAARLMARLTHLSRVRSGKKYLAKLAASGGLVHPTCGPAGDEDGRAGAVTGRLGVKGEFEAQQLPTREDVDLYQLRRAIAQPAKAMGADGEWRVYLQVHDELCLRHTSGRGQLVVADFSALEVVVLADLCLRLFGDDQLAQATAPGAPDIHCVNARYVFGDFLGWKVPATVLDDARRPVPCPYAGNLASAIPMAEFKTHPYGAQLRSMVKTVWYGLQYGKGGYGFSVLPGPDGREVGEEVGQKLVDGVLAAVPGLASWQRWCRRFVDAHRGIYSLCGRWCDLELESADSAPEWLRNRGYRRAYNFPMQATVAALCGDAMVRVGGDAELRALPADAHEEVGRRLLTHMEAATANGTRLLVPVRGSVGYGRSYWEAK